MNAIDFLIKEHNKVKTMLADISDHSHHYETRKKKFAILSQDLIRHEFMEHNVNLAYLFEGSQPRPEVVAPLSRFRAGKF